MSSSSENKFLLSAFVTITCVIYLLSPLVADAPHRTASTSSAKGVLESSTDLALAAGHVLLGKLASQ